jgi:hypothetical protein
VSSLLKPRPHKLGPYQISAGQLSNNNWNSIRLDGLPYRNDNGVGIVTAIELYCQCTVATTASSAAVKAYRLHRLIDWQLVGPDGFIHVDRLGYHDAVREYLQFGEFGRQTCADLPATGGSAGSYPRTFTKFMSFLQPGMRDPYFACLPSAYFARGQLRIFPHGTGTTYSGATASLSDLTITAYVHILDVPAAAVPIGAFIQEGYGSLNNEPRPSPGAGRYLRLAATLDPATATYEDDLGSITSFDFGASDGAGMIHRNRDTVELIREWNQINCRDQKPNFGTLTSPQEFYRFLDPTANVSGDLHALPLVFPRRRDGVQNMPLWNSRPELRINNDNRSGVPAAFDLIWDRFASREPKHIQNVMESVRQGSYGRFRGEAAHMAPGYAGVDPRHAPLIVDAR